MKPYLFNLNIFFFFQFNLSLFAQSTYKLEFNLYPLKAGWQGLPEFVITFSTNEESRDKRCDEQQNNMELRKLVERWMPKKVFILPMIKISQV